MSKLKHPLWASGNVGLLEGNNNLHCAQLLPNRMYRRREYLIKINRDGIPMLEAVPTWAYNNGFITTGLRPVEKGLTNRGAVYLNFLNQAYRKPTSRWNAGLNMYFSADQKEKNNPDHPAYGMPTYAEITLMEDVVHSELGLYLNPTGQHFDTDWVKYDESGYHRKLDSYQEQKEEKKDVN